MTIMFCQECFQIEDCTVESPQPSNRTIYFENPYMNAYIRERTCSTCKRKFKTYEIGEASFFALRKILELNNEIGEFIDETWADTENEFFAPISKTDQQKESIKNFKKSQIKKESLIKTKVIPLQPEND